MTTPYLILNESDLLDPFPTFRVEGRVTPSVDVFRGIAYSQPLLPSAAQNLVVLGSGGAPRGDDGLVWPTGVQRFG